MPDNFFLYLLLVAALAIGFLLGRRDRFRPGARPTRVADDYFRGLNHLINEREDPAVDRFVEAVVEGTDTVDTHLALGSLARRRGELDRAIRIHQGLLARPALSATQRTQSELELARDYVSAGLLGRAEKLLLELSQRHGPHRPTSQRLLLGIYQREREWLLAVKVGSELARDDRGMRPQLAHFQCELAQAALTSGDLRSAREALAEGRRFDAQCARVPLMGAQVELAAGRPREARTLLERAVALDADLVAEAVQPYGAACDLLDDRAGYRGFLERCIERSPYLPAVKALAQHLEQGAEPGAASTFLLEQLLREPSLGGFVELLEHLDRDGQPLEADRLQQVKRFSQSLLDTQPLYRCRSCGFPSRSRMWQCPSCHEWAAIRPILGVERSA